MRRSEGQGSVEYIAIAFLVVGVLTAAVAITSGGLGQAVEASIRRGICTAVQRECPLLRAVALSPDLEVCPVERQAGNQQVSLEAGVIRLAAQLGLGVERMADGRVRVSFVDGGTGGIGASVGAHVRLAGWEGRSDASADVGVSLTAGRVWVLPNAASARKFVGAFASSQKVSGRLRQLLAKACPVCGVLAGRTAAPPKPDETWVSGGITVAGALGVAAGPTGGKLEAVLRGAVGRRVTRTGTIWFVRVDDRLIGSIDATVAGIDGQADATAVASLELDPRGVPVRLKIVRETRFSRKGGPKLPASLKRILGQARAGRGEAVDFESSLYLRDASDQRLAVDLLQALTSANPRHALELGVLLSRAVDGHGVRTVRRWAISRDLNGVGAGASFGVRLGADATSSTEDQRLVSVDSKLPGLDWLPRADCLVV